MDAALAWEREGSDWPNRAASRFVEAAGLRWHVQRLGAGRTLLLVHGTGASTHSWRDLAPLLAARFDVIAPDLPGHAFTEMPPSHRLSLPGMAAALRGLLDALAARPIVVVGHSAGAAILARMCLDGALDPRVLVSLNGSLLPLGGMKSPALGPLVRLIVGSGLVPRLFASQAARPEAVERLLEQTGSTLDTRGVGLYRRLASQPQHVAAALGMMAHWDVRSLERDLPRLRTPLMLAAGTADRMIPPSHAERVRRLVSGARLVTLPGVGHLAHEERPQEIAALLESVVGAVAA